MNDFWWWLFAAYFGVTLPIALAIGWALWVGRKNGGLLPPMPPPYIRPRNPNKPAPGMPWLGPQCDGCQRGLPTRQSDHGSLMHDGPDGMPVMICTAGRYQGSGPAQPGKGDGAARNA
jgi:hypothetical protein